MSFRPANPPRTVVVLVAALLTLLLCAAIDASYPPRFGDEARGAASSTAADAGTSFGGSDRVGAPLNDALTRTVNIERRDSGSERSRPHRVLLAALAAVALGLLVLVCRGRLRARRVPRPASRRSLPASGRAPPFLAI